jgi:hypothetical protein
MIVAPRFPRYPPEYEKYGNADNYHDKSNTPAVSQPARGEPLVDKR